MCCQLCQFGKVGCGERPAERMSASVLALLLAVGMVMAKESGMTGNVTMRDVDGGEGEFTSLCVLEGYYQFSVEDLSLTSFCLGPAYLSAHFYTKKGHCYADVVFVASAERWCLTTVPGGGVEGHVRQHFSVSTYVTVDFDVFALSQSQPSLFLSTQCCVTNAVLVGTPVDDVNTAGIRSCANSYIDFVLC